MSLLKTHSRHVCYYNDSNYNYNDNIYYYISQSDISRSLTEEA